MNLVRSLKKACKVAIIVLSYITIYSSIEAKRQYEEIKGEHLVLSKNIADIKEHLDSLSKVVSATSKKEDNGDKIICATSIEKKANNDTHTVKEYNGIIGIFDGNGILIRELDIEVSTLPESDREDLSVGIRVYSSDELEKLIDQFR